MNPKIAIFLHVYHFEIMSEIDKYLSTISYDFDLYINFAKDKTNPENIDKTIEYYQKKFSTKFYYSISSNRGLDPGGFIISANYAIKMQKQYDYICKIHTKRGYGIENSFGIQAKKWGSDLYKTLIGSNERFEEIINIFKTKPEVGMISCIDYLSYEIGSNEKPYKILRKKLGLDKKICFPNVQNFIGGTMFWVRGQILDFFKKTQFDLKMFEEVDISNPKRDGTLAHAFERIFPAMVRHQGYELFLLPVKKTKTKKPKIISFYFPQYHQIPENDLFWGKGFTEWNNLKTAKLKFKDQKILHPHKRLGYYNLLDPKIRKLQGDLAKEHGIYGFCYHHYWFSGRKVMYKPTEAMLIDGYPDLPFCFNWANEPWTKNWDGLEADILLDQKYGDISEWDKHFFYLLDFFKHKKYIKINNKPVFLIYRTGHIKKLYEMISWWNTRAIENGFDGIYFIQCLGSFEDSNIYSKDISAVCEFQPNFSNITKLPNQTMLNENIVGKTKEESCWIANLESKYQAMTAEKGLQKQVIRQQDFQEPSLQFSFSSKVRNSGQAYYNGFFSGWDNTPRRQKSMSGICMNRSKENYKLYLTRQLYNTIVEKNPNTDEKLLFLNSWNEWGEGCVLEPDDHKADFTLKQTKAAVDDIDKYFISSPEDESDG